MNRFLTIREFMTRYRVGRTTVYRQHRAGRLPFHKIGRSTRIAESDALAWFESLPVRP